MKSVTFNVTGDYAYGYLKAEAGIHRLVRISPFDANSRRHTSFASVFVYPEVDDDIKIEIDDDDLRVDTYRSSGAGGQHVNKTDSAVRLTHLPSGIVVACQNERSQHKNRAMAMKILQIAPLRARARKTESRRWRAITRPKRTSASAARSAPTCLHPYRMVKDHRTNIEIGNADAVLDGDIDPFIEAYFDAEPNEQAAVLDNCDRPELFSIFQRCTKLEMQLDSADVEISTLRDMAKMVLSRCDQVDSQGGTMDGNRSATATLADKWTN